MALQGHHAELAKRVTMIFRKALFCLAFACVVLFFALSWLQEFGVTSISSHLHATLMFVLLGLPHVIFAGLTMSRNWERSKDDPHSVNAPYAGNQKVNPKTAFFLNLTLMTVGISSILFGVYIGLSH